MKEHWEDSIMVQRATGQIDGDDSGDKETVDDMEFLDQKEEGDDTNA